MIRIYLLSLSLFSFSCFAMGTQSVIDHVTKQIEKDTELFAQKMNWNEYRYSSQLRHPSSLKKLDSCLKPLHIETATQDIIYRVRYKVTCALSSKKQKWSVNFNAEINYYVPVASLVNAQSRGHVIENEDVYFIEKRVKRNTHYYFHQPNIIGKKLKRDLRKNTLLQEKDIQIETLVTRGREVIIVLDSPALSLSTIGIPLKSAGKGDSIKVRNKRSGNIITATVVGKNKVAVKIN